MMQIGDRIDVDITAIAHGGHCIARHDGRVIFVRHAIPGERVTVEITDITKNFARGNCVSVISQSTHRVNSPCAYAKPDGCGGCDFQHIEISHQRTLKAAIITEQFHRLAKMEIEVSVEEVPPNLHWRNRMEFTVSDNSKLGLFASRSARIIEIDRCLIASEKIDIPTLNSRRLPKGKRVDVAITDSGEQEVIIEGRENFALIKERVGDFEFSLNPVSFWQSHSAAPELLSKVVREFTEAALGDHIFDLYGGVGLFTAALLPEVGPGGRVTLVESDDNAITDAKRNFAADERVEVVHGRVEKALKKYVAANVVILDPPRSGAGVAVINTVVALRPRAIVYVACDPASLARDTAYLKDRGFKLQKLRAFDLFPMTAHMECVARFIPE
ncbi:MAG: class I SAM-dependent RNA methyltransferase [Actinomycetota bacterium]